MTRKATLGIAIALVAVGLSGCEDTKKALGLVKSPPDEFAVVARAPLTMPPDFGLRPPRSPSDKPAAETASEAGRQTVFRLQETPQQAAAARDASLSAGEKALVTQAGVASADPSVRSAVDRETAALAESNKSFVDSLIFWRAPAVPGEVVDASKETQRLRENAALGKSPSAGDTPQIEHKSRALLEGIF